MYKYIFILLLTGCATTDWIEVGKGENHIYYMHKDQRLLQNNNVYVTEMVNFTSPQNRDGMKYLSIQGLAEYNCGARAWRVNHEAYFAGNMGQGKRLLLDSKTTQWVGIAPQMVSHTIHRSVCTTPVAKQGEMDYNQKMMFMIMGNTYLNTM